MVEISKVILVVSFIFTFTCSFGQQLINGRIIDENSKPMPYANVILINQVDCKRLHICVDVFTKTPHDIFCHGAFSF